MYPKNAASPPRIAVGAVVQISDGAVQTADVLIKVMPQGGAASAGGGTTGYEEGVVHYLPTQAETNYEAFMVIAYKTGCIPAAQTIVTTASATAGYAGVDWSKVTAPTTTLNLSGTTIATTQKVDVETIKTNPVVNGGTITFPTGATLASTTNITAGTISTVTTLTGHTPQTGDTYALANGVNGFVAIKGDTAAILADTGTDGVVVAAGSKTGYSLTATTGLGNQTADITGSLSGSVGSVTGAVGSVTGAVGSVTGNVGGNVTGSVGSLAAQAKADVNAEVLDVLNTDTFAEPGQEAPGATVSLAKKIGYLYKAWRNKSTQTATTYSLYADDATTVDQKATVSDDATTATRGEVATGP